MATTSFTAIRRLAGFAITLLFCLSFFGKAVGQSTAPLVTVSSVAGLSHPTGWGTIQQTAIDSFGDWFVVDYANGALYEFPAGGGAAVTIAPPSPSASLGGGYQNPGIAIDPDNNIYLEANWNNCLVMFPFNAATSTWTGLNDGASTDLSSSNPTTTICTNSGKNNEPEAWAQYSVADLTGTGLPGYFQPWGLAIGNNDNLIFGDNGGNDGIAIHSILVNGAWANPTPAGVNWVPATGLSERPMSIAQDQQGNAYFVEDYTCTNCNLSIVPGVLEIPASTTNGQFTSDCPVHGNGTTEPPTGSSCINRVDPNLPQSAGVITDASGNLYISDAQVGVVMVPNSAGTPQTSSAVLLTGVPAQGEVSIDWARNLMYVPTTQKQGNGQADVAIVGFGSAEYGSSPVGTTVSTGSNVVFGFNGSVTPASFSIVEDGVQNPDFVISGGTCTTGTAYAANQSCLQNVSFTPHSVGSVSAKLLMLDAKSNVLASMVLHGSGIGANIQATPSLQSTIAGGLKTPSQIAVDPAGNLYVADSGLGEVLMYAAGSSAPVSIGTGLTAPTGVAVDGAGDVFIADSGYVYEVPFGPTGLNTAGQVTLASGLGTTGLQLAADGSGHLYVADPSNGRVVKVSDIGASTASTLGTSSTFLTTGFTAPSAVAVDSNNNLYVIDGSNLFEVAGGIGAPATMLTTLSNATSLAVDPSGAVYLSAAGGTVRIPFVGSALVDSNPPAIAASVTNPTSVALDRWGNAYVADGTALNVQLVSINGTIPLPQPSSLTSSSTNTATIVNAGNSTLTVSGYTSSNSVDFTAADGTCESGSPIPVGGTCQVVITFAPGPGEQGSLSSKIGITSTAVNSPIVITASGNALALSVSVASANVGSTAEVINTPFVVTITPKSGSGIPSGQVTVSYPSWTVIIPASGTNAGIPTINPVTDTVTATLDATGKATFALSPVLAGTDSFTVNYGGDRVYGRSTFTITATVAKSAITGIQLPAFPDATDIDLPFVTASNGNGTVPYDGSELPWQYNFKMTVNTAAGIPTGSLTVMDNVTSCPPGTSAAGIGAATCILAGYSAPGGYSGVACPNVAGAGVLTIENSGGTMGAQAAFPTSCLWFVPQGVSYSPVIFTHYIVPVYSGDANFLGFNGPTPTLIQSVRGPMLQITQTGNASSLTAAPTLSISPGSTASMNLSLTSRLGYGIAGANGQLNASNFPVSLSCDNLPPHTQCSFTYPNPDPTIANAVDIPCPSGATTTEIADGSVSCTPGLATVTFYTNVSAGTTTGLIARTTSVALAAIFGFGMIGLFFRRKAFEKARLMMMVFLMIVGTALAVSLTACNTTTLSSQATLATPAGTYAVTITADEVGTLCVSSPGQAGDNCIVPGSGSATDNGQLVYGSLNQVSLPFYVNLKVK
jgi:sugar lactone lactonase YvrE